MSTPLIAWGSMAASCRDTSAFLDACIGCDWAHGVLLVDSKPTERLPSCGSTMLHVEWARPLVPAWAMHVSSLNSTHEVGVEIADFNTRYFKLVALFRVLTSHATTARASWYLKVDLDTFVSVRALGRILAHWTATSSAGYIGKPIRTFHYRGRPLTFMQGGGFALSQAGAAALSRCWRPFGPDTRCPNRALEDVSNARVADAMKQRCFNFQSSPWADDMYVGACMHDAKIVAGEEPCVFAHRPGQQLRPQQLSACEEGCLAMEHALKRPRDLKRRSQAARAAGKACTTRGVIEGAPERSGNGSSIAVVAADAAGDARGASVAGTSRGPTRSGARGGGRLTRADWLMTRDASIEPPMPRSASPTAQAMAQAPPAARFAADGRRAAALVARWDADADGQLGSHELARMLAALGVLEEFRARDVERRRHQQEWRVREGEVMDKDAWSRSEM